MNIKKAGIILAHPFVGWALCFATIGIGMAVTSQNNALIIHAIMAPVYFVIISIFYFRKFGYTKPLPTALIFIIIVMALDFFLVALVIIRSLVMFTSLLGTWIPFALIFLSTYITGLLVTRQKER
jgi:hypothetical protein